MARSNCCDGCPQAGACRDVYDRVGRAEGPSVVSKVAVAFLLPILMFLIALGVFQWALGSAVAEPYQTPSALLLALLATIGLMFVTRALVRLCRKKQDRE